MSNKGFIRRPCACEDPSEIWGVPVEGWSIEKMDQMLEQRLKEGAAPFWIVTANPEILLFARSHTEYAQTLRQADTRTVDGMGLYAMLKIFGRSVTRVTDVALAEHVLEIAQRKQWRVGLIGGSPNVAQQAKEALEKRLTGLPFPHGPSRYILALHRHE